MRARLEHLDLRGLDLELGSDERRVVLGDASELRGQLVLESDRFVIEDASLARGEVASLQLRFGETTVVAEHGLLLEDVRGGARREADQLSLEIAGAHARSPRLALQVGDVSIGGQIDLADVRFRLDGADGVVVAERVVLTDVVLSTGAASVTLERVEGTHVVIAWGADGLRVEAAGIEVSRAELQGALPEKRKTGEPTSERSDVRTVSADDLLSLLDGLSGEINVDLGLDLTVPVIGRRNATHRFRIPIADGSVDYMGLEKDLSTLESALLDFAMRDDDLVLEMGIPFVPTRGLGKPILRWKVAGNDLALAKRQRIRLALLPRFEVAADQENKQGGRSRIALRHLELRDLDARLRVQLASPPRGLPLHRVDELTVAGSVSHSPDAPPKAGRMRGRIAGVELGPVTVPLGDLALSLERLALHLAEELEISFVGVEPRTACATLRGVTLGAVRLAPRSTLP